MKICTTDCATQLAKLQGVALLTTLTWMKWEWEGGSVKRGSNIIGTKSKEEVLGENGEKGN